MIAGVGNVYRAEVLFRHRPNHIHAVEGHDATVTFAADFPSAGTYRLFLDFAHDGEVRTAADTSSVQFAAVALLTVHLPPPKAAIHMAAVTQLRHQHSDGRAYFDRKVAEGKTKREALRSLKRHVSNAVYRQLLADANHTKLSCIEAAGLRGVDVGRRWDSIADRWAAVLAGGGAGQYAFNDVHAMLAYVGADRAAAHGTRRALDAARCARPGHARRRSR